MPARLFLIALTFVLAVLPAMTAEAKRVALVIGNDAYAELPVLAKAAADAHAYAELLEAAGFDAVALHTDLTRAGMDEAIAAFVALVAPGDTAVFAYAGHGWSDGVQNFLVGIDAPQRATPEFLARISVPLRNGLNGILDDLDRRGAALKVAIIDACRDNPFVSTEPGRSLGLGRGLVRVEPPRGTFVIFSAGAGQVALDRLNDADPDPNSVFTRVFVPLARTGMPLQEAVAAARREVVALAARVDHNQQPAYYDEVVGPICLGECRGEAVAAAPGPAIDRDALFWSSIAGSDSAADFEAYLAQFPDGVFAVLARNRIAQLAAAETVARLDPADGGDSPDGAAPAAKATLYEKAEGDDGEVTILPGTVAWRLAEAGADGPVAEARIAIPGRQLAIAMTVRRNPAEADSAPHRLDIAVELPADFHAGGIAQIPGIVTKPEEDEAGTIAIFTQSERPPGVLIAEPAGEDADAGRFGFLLWDDPAAGHSDIGLIDGGGWIVLGMLYENGHRAILSIEKGAAGGAAIAAVMAAR